MLRNIEMLRRTLPSAVTATWLVALVVGLSLPTTGFSDDANYDAEQLQGNISVDGQDNWNADPLGGEATVAVDHSGVNGSQVLSPLATDASDRYAMLTRVNDGRFGFSPFLGFAKTAVSGFDATGAGVAGFGLGTDVDGNGRLNGDEVGPVFGLVRDPATGLRYFAIRGAAFGTLHKSELPRDEEGDPWYRLQLRMNLQNGTGSLYYRNLSNWDPGFSPVPNLQNIDLEHWRLNPGAAPWAWNAMWVGMLAQGNQNRPSVDNLIPRVPVVVEPDGSIQFQAIDGMEGFGWKADARLERYDNPTDPQGYYWRLREYRISDPISGSWCTLMPNYDIEIDMVDVQALELGADLLTDVVLEYQGMEGGDVHTMTWRLVQ
jgi:hypothetical protein